MTALVSNHDLSLRLALLSIRVFDCFIPLLLCPSFYQIQTLQQRSS